MDQIEISLRSLIFITRVKEQILEEYKEDLKEGFSNAIRNYLGLTTYTNSDFTIDFGSFYCSKERYKFEKNLQQIAYNSFLRVLSSSKKFQSFLEICLGIPFIDPECIFITFSIPKGAPKFMPLDQLNFQMSISYYNKFAKRSYGGQLPDLFLDVTEFY